MAQSSSVIVAAMFSPLRRGVRRAVDRRFNRARYDAERAVSAFGERVRDSVRPGSVGPDLVEVVRDVFEPAAVGLWIRRSTSDPSR